MCRVWCGIGLGLGAGNLYVGDFAWHGEEMVLDREASIRRWRGLYGVRHLWYTLLGFNRVRWYRHLRDVAGIAGGLRVEAVTV